jgi:NAD(P)-dependent dehydrogenase (short-subunit alcohol dehydrogenase family)
MNAEQRGAVVVTGASTGIGAACADRLATIGFQVFAGVRCETSVQKLVERHAGRVTPILLDVTKEDAVTAARERIETAVGAAGLAGLINNAGVAVGGPLELVPMADLRRQLETNVIGTAATTQALLPLLREGRGRIVNVGSTSGRVAAPFAGPYAMSKFALRAYNDSLRVEVRPWGIEVSLIEVGPVQTGIWDKSLSELDERWDSASPSARDLYGPLFKAIRRTAEERGRSGIPVEQVVAAIEDAVAGPKPRAHYIIGKIAWQIAVVSLLPDRLRDRLVLNHLGL